MTKNILVAVAWPYASADIHVGNMTGSYLPADIYARFHRLQGNQVLMVSGSDSHGTPIMVRADQENSTPEEVYKKYHAKFLDLFQRSGLSYDLFTTTHTENHFKVAQTIFSSLKENGYLYTETKEHWYSTSQERFLPDRYVEGTCYICGYENARGDQCDNCGSLLEATSLINPQSKMDGSTPELRETEHFYLDLGALQPKIVDFLKAREEYWRPNVIRQSLGQILAEDLHGRAITRDLKWGIPVPVSGWEDKSLYVWFEAVIGYLSATIEWASLSGDPDRWKDWWYNPEGRSYYFIGKDNIPFHAVIWPAELAGVGRTFGAFFDEDNQRELVLPYDVPANEFLNMEGKKISGSRNWVVDGLDFLTRYDPDPLRYYLTANMPETRDTDWEWSKFVTRNNNELVATWGNLVNRVLSFAHKNWEGYVPDPGDLRPEDEAILKVVEEGFDHIAELYDKVKLRAALTETMRLAGEVNKYLDEKAPWFEIKEDKQSAGKSIYTAIRAIDSLKILFAPVLPFTCEQLHQILGYEKPIFGEQYTEEVPDNLSTHTVLRYRAGETCCSWQPSEIQGGREFHKPKPLFKKLDPEIVEQELERLG
ncbi:MAG TPA: methionine--tRNA ligase [Chloroflexi bacterium]|nr:MAG: methionine--tRNA ligase [Chloroflexota bacterium]HDD55042.1 methionine--tRNA ligase [Chloroflexota bacterium]